MRLRVLSLNVWGLPPPIGLHVGERLGLVLRDLPALDCDVVLLQELWTDEGRRQLIEGARSFGYAHAFHVPGPARGGSGLLTLSRLPFAGSGFRRFTLCGLPQRLTQMDYYSGKGVARVDLSPDGVPVAVFNTHLHARYAPRGVVDEYRGHRTAEVIEMADEIRGTPAVAIAGGDFNMVDSSPEYRLLQGLTGLVDSAAVLGSRRPTSTLENAYRLARGAQNEARIDYLFARGGLQGVRAVSCERVYDDLLEVAGEPGAHSDHAGVLAEFEIGGPGRPPVPFGDDVVDLARQLLDAGREVARRRRRDERAGAGLCLAVGGCAAVAARNSRWSRRRLLRTGLAAGAVFATGASAGLLTLSEHFVPQELEGYDAVYATLARLRDSRP